MKTVRIQSSGGTNGTMPLAKLLTVAVQCRWTDSTLDKLTDLRVGDSLIVESIDDGPTITITRTS